MIYRNRKYYWRTTIAKQRWQRRDTLQLSTEELSKPGEQAYRRPGYRLGLDFHNQLIGSIQMLRGKDAQRKRCTRGVRVSSVVLQQALTIMFNVPGSCSFGDMTMRCVSSHDGCLALLRWRCYHLMYRAIQGGDGGRTCLRSDLPHVWQILPSARH